MKTVAYLDETMVGAAVSGNVTMDDRLILSKIVSGTMMESEAITHILRLIVVSADLRRRLSHKEKSS